MRLIKTTPPPPPDAPRFRTRRSGWKISLILWMIALTIMLAVVLGIFVHFSLTFERMLQELSA